MCTMIRSLLLFVTAYFFFFKQKTAYEMRISDWSSDVCSSDLDDVVDGDHADQAARFIDHCGRDQRIFLEAERDFLLVHVDRDQGLLAPHEVSHGDVARRAQDPGELHRPHRMMLRIDDEDFPDRKRVV